MKKIALLCEVLHPPLDEGIRIVAAEVASALARRCEVALLGPREAEVRGMRVEGVLTDRYFAGRALARVLARGRPDGILYVPFTSLTSRTFVRLAALRWRAPQAALGVMGLQPRDTGILVRIGARFGRPDAVFAVGPEVERQAAALGLAPRRLEGGVDLGRFRPQGEEPSADLRRALGLPGSAYIVLHVGHLKPARGILALRAVQALDGVQAVLVSSSSTEADAGARRALMEAGVRVVDQHLPNVEEYYRAANCYLFPVRSSLDAIELPLSVLEAAACDLPIVTTRFGGLPALLEGAGAGVAFVGAEEEIPRVVRAFSKDRPRPRLRDRLKGLTWDAMAERILAGLEDARAGAAMRVAEARG